MATEDHDFEEINYFNFKGRKFRWNKESTGPVRLSTEGLSDELYAQELGSSTNAETLKSLFEAASQARQSSGRHANANSLLEHTVW
jgi:uncharacterized protein YllA (UPF0747 family)